MKNYSEDDVKAMKKAIEFSATALKNDDSSDPRGGPFGAAIYKNGKPIAFGCNHVLARCDPSAHAEVFTIRKACKKLKTWDLSGCVLYSSCEPCPMCLMTAKWANIDKIFFSATRKDAADVGFRDDELYSLLKKGVFATQIEECRKDAVEIMHLWAKKFTKNGKY